MQKIRAIVLQFKIVGVLTIVLMHQISAVYIVKDKMLSNPFDIGASMVSFMSQIVPTDLNCIDVSENETEAPLQGSSEMEDEIPHVDFLVHHESEVSMYLIRKFNSTVNFLLIPQDFVELHSPPPDLG